MLSCLYSALVNTALMWILFVILYVSGAERIDWNSVPWGVLGGVAACNLGDPYVTKHGMMYTVASKIQSHRYTLT